MNSFPIEDLSASEWQDRLAWLIATCGESSKETWWVDIQPRIEDLLCNDKIAVLYKLRWT